MCSEKLENLIDMALADGILSEKEKQVLFKNSEAEGIDLDEFEIVLNARLHQRRQAILPKEDSEKQSTYKKKNQVINISDNKDNKKSISGWVCLVIAAAYTISPIDIIPDVPIVGWVDDAAITVPAILQFIETENKGKSSWLSKIAKTLKWICIILGVIVVLIVLLFGTLIVKLFT
jgi:uncharacterized membrane protein YkvA (DUF1232 family)